MSTFSVPHKPHEQLQHHHHHHHHLGCELGVEVGGAVQGGVSKGAAEAGVSAQEGAAVRGEEAQIHTQNWLHEGQH